MSADFIGCDCEGLCSGVFYLRAQMCGSDISTRVNLNANLEVQSREILSFTSYQ